MSVRPEELLAAYADDGLEPEERALVEHFLTQNPSSARELDELQSVVERLREHACAERTGPAPSWDAMAADIRRGCDQAEAARARRWPVRLRTRLRRLFTPGPALALGAAVMATAALLLVIRHWGKGGHEPQIDRNDPAQLVRSDVQTTDEPAMVPTRSLVPAIRPPVDNAVLVDEPMIGAFPDDLHAAFDTIDGEVMDGELMENVEWLADDMALLTGLELDVLAEPTYEDSLEDMSDATLEELLAQAG